MSAFYHSQLQLFQNFSMPFKAHTLQTDGLTSSSRRKSLPEENTCNLFPKNLKVDTIYWSRSIDSTSPISFKLIHFLQRFSATSLFQVTILLHMNGCSCLLADLLGSIFFFTPIGVKHQAYFLLSTLTWKFLCTENIVPCTSTPVSWWIPPFCWGLSLTDPSVRTYLTLQT